MGRYDDDIAATLEAIIEAGETVTLEKYNSTDASVSTPWRPGTPDVVQQSAFAVFLDFKGTRDVGQAYFQNELVPAGDKKILVAASGLAWPPVLQAVVRRSNGEVWKIQRLQTLSPNGQDILYTIQGRQ